MRLAVLGGTSYIDRHFLQQTLRSGYAISLLASEVDPIFNHPKLNIIHGNLADHHYIDTALTGTHAVIALPHAITSMETLETLIQAMYAHGIFRLIIAADLSQPQSQQFEYILKKTSIDWTIIQYTQSNSALAVPHKELAGYLMRQITDVTHVRSAMLLSN